MKETIVLKKVQLFEKLNARSMILAILFRYPYQEFTLSELAKYGKTAKSTASDIVSGLEKDGLAKVVDLGIIWRIQANRESFSFIKEKILYNLGVIYKSGIVEYIAQVYHPKAIILFGSFRKGEDAPGSDVDIAVEISEDSDLNVVRVDDFKYLESQIDRKINLYFFNRNKIDLNLFNNIANGMVLSGFLEVHP